MVEIRKLGMQDVAQFREVRLQALREFPSAFGSSVEKEEKVPLVELEKTWSARNPENDFVVGAFQNGDLIGVVGFVQQTRHHKTAHKGLIWGMYVKPQIQQSGIGKQLIEFAIQQAKMIAGLELIQLAVVTDNLRAKRLYQKVGFQTFGTEKHALKVDGAYHDEDHMVLFL